MCSRFSQEQQESILQKLLEKVRREWERAIETDSLQELMNTYGISLTENVLPISKQASRILVIGDIAGRKKDYYGKAKTLGIQENSLVFVADYDKLTNFSLAQLEYSTKYSDVIVGPVPHSMKGKGEYSSIISAMEQQPDIFPRVIRAQTANEMKLTISSFQKALQRTRFYECFC